MKYPEGTTKRGYSLPKLRDRRGEVSGIQWYPERLVLPESVFHAGRRVPLLVAVCPGQDALERLEQVVEPPGQDHDVVHVQKGHNHYGSITNSWREERNTCRCDRCFLLGRLVVSWSWCCSCCHCGLVSCSPANCWKLNSTTRKHRPAPTSDQHWHSGLSSCLWFADSAGEVWRVSTQFNSNLAIPGFIRGKSRLTRELHHPTSWATSFSPHCPSSQLPWRQLSWAAQPTCKKTKERKKTRQFSNELKRKIPKLSTWKLLFLPQFNLCKWSTIFVAATTD